jgi:transglutaminase-like putative cysteine protease
MKHVLRFLLWFCRHFAADWQAKMRALLTGLMLWQFAVWFDEYLLSDTEWLVRAAIVTVIAMEWLPRVRPVWRRLLALAVLLALHVFRLDIGIGEIGGREGAWAFLRALAGALGQAAMEFHPYVWFSLGTMAIHWLLADWFTERVRIAFATVSSVAIIALVDSYSKLILWEQAAAIVFAGLGLLIVEHLDKFRVRHPTSWAYLRDYPGSIIIPSVIVLSLAMLAGVLAPNARPLLTDPYTLYKHWKGERVVTGGKGFASEEWTLVSTLSGESGYGRDDRVLGGGFDYDYSQVMRIMTSQRTYWRGESKSFYTGFGWLDSDAEEDPPVVAFDGEPLPVYAWEPEPPVGKTVQVRQQVTVYGEVIPFPVLFGAPGITSVKLGSEAAASYGNAADGASSGNGAAADGQPVHVGIWLSRQGELYRINDEYPRTYTVESAVPVTDEEGWRSVTQDAFDALYADNLERWAPYLQLPDTLPERVRRLAEDIAAEAETPYDKVKNIEQYLKTAFPYSNRPDWSKGQSEDFVDRFLFEIREGYCDYFSTAMAVMVRSIGLPARWVKGFKTGINELELRMPGMVPEDYVQNARGEGVYIVRNADAHSWVEVYFPGYGWIPFEPTSGFTMPDVAEPESAAETMAPVLPDAMSETGGSAAEETGSIVSLAVAVLAAVLAAAAGLYRLLGRTAGWAAVRNRLHPFGGRPQRSLNEAALGEAVRILKWLARKGFPREPHETVREAVVRWTARNGRLKPDFERLAAVVERARYSPDGVTADDVAALEGIRRRLKEQLK